MASAETAVFLHSYRATLIEAYRHSALLLRPAVRNAMENKGLAPEALGPVYRLPGNMDVLAFIARRLWNSVLRLIYGALREKRWRVATAEIKGGSALGTLHAALSRTAEWQTPAIPAGYRFLADPFFHPREGLLVEGLSTTSNKGKILHLVGKVCSSYSGLGGHFSYPSVVRGDSSFLVPEVCDWSPALAYPILETGLGQPIELQVPGRPRLIDPTPFRWGEDIFLFGNIVSEGPSVLRLWVSKGLDQPFAEHPASPIRISPEARGWQDVHSSLTESWSGSARTCGADTATGTAFSKSSSSMPKTIPRPRWGNFAFATARAPTR